MSVNVNPKMKTQIICSVLLFGLVSALPAPQFFCMSFSSNLTVVSFLTAPTHSNQRTRQHDVHQLFDHHCHYWKRVVVGRWDNYMLGWRMGIYAYTEPEREQFYLVLKHEDVLHRIGAERDALFDHDHVF